MNPDDLESRLARRPTPTPDPGLRGRILAAVAAEARRPRARPWPRAWRAAAAVVLGLNLALGVANGLRYQSLQPPGPPVALRSAPSGDPFRAYAALAVAQLLPAPDVGAVGRRFIEQEENRAWGTP